MDTIVLGHTFTTVEDCEDAWSSAQGGAVTCSYNALHKVGTYSAKMVMAAASGGLLASEVVALDLSGTDFLAVWVYSTVDLSSGDLQILLSEEASCANPSESLDIPEITASTWTRVAMPFVGTTASRDTLISVGVSMISDVGNFSLYLDDLQAFSGLALSTLGIRGMIDPDDIELNGGPPVKLLDGSYYEDEVPSYNRNITVSLGPVMEKSDRIFLFDFWMTNTKRLIAQGDEVSVARGGENFSNTWLEGLDFAKSFTLPFKEKTARTTNPTSFDSAAAVSFSGDTLVISGVRYYVGSGVPLSTLGNDGDWYWDETNLNDYTKRDGSWQER